MDACQFESDSRYQFFMKLATIVLTTTLTSILITSSIIAQEKPLTPTPTDGTFAKELTPEVVDKAFTLADLNKDGVLSKGEFADFLKSVKRPRKSKKIVEAVKPAPDISPE